MRKAIPLLLALVAAIAVTRYAAAQDAPPPDGPRPDAKPQCPNAEKIFDRLDVNHDGAITSAEIPPAMPERMRQLLIVAVKKHDGKLTKGDLIEIIKQHREARRGRGGPPMFDAKAIFARLDKDKDGKLSLEEFSAGVERMHRAMKMMHHGRPPMGPQGPKGHQHHGRSFDGDRGHGYHHQRPRPEADDGAMRHPMHNMYWFADRSDNGCPSGERPQGHYGHHGRQGHHGPKGWTEQTPRHAMAQVWTDRDAGPRADHFQHGGSQDLEVRLVALERKQARILTLLEKLLSDRKGAERGPRGK